MIKLLLIFLLNTCGNSNSVKKPNKETTESIKKEGVKNYINLEDKSLQLDIRPTKEIFYETQKGDIKRLIGKVAILIESLKEASEIQIEGLAKEYNYNAQELEEILTLKEKFKIALEEEQTLDQYKDAFIDKASRILKKEFFNKTNLETNDSSLIDEYNEYSYKKLSLFAHLFEKAYKAKNDMISFSLANLVQGFYNCVTGVIAVTEQSILLFKNYRKYNTPSDFINDSLNSLKKEILNEIINSGKVSITTSNNQKADTDNPHTFAFIFSLVKEELKMDIPFHDYITFGFKVDKDLILEEFSKEYNLEKIKDSLLEYQFEDFSELKGLGKETVLKSLLIKEKHLIIKE